MTKQSYGPDHRNIMQFLTKFNQFCQKNDDHAQQKRKKVESTVDALESNANNSRWILNVWVQQLTSE